MIPAQPPQTPPPPTLIQLPKLLLVEGNTPMHFFEALLRHLGLQPQIEIRNFGSINNLRPVLLALATTDEFKRLVTSVGVVRDAENDAAAALQSVQDVFAAAGLTLAAMPHIRTAIFILPDNSSPGKIETLCMQSVRADPDHAPVYSCAEEFFACVQQNGQLPAKFDEAKAYAQVFLATREDVQLFPGLAAYRGYWPWDSAVFDPLKQFLRAL
jgi:hypothetical protein